MQKNYQKTLNVWKESNTCLYNPWINEENTIEVLKYFELNDNENMTHHNLSNVAKAIFRGKFLSLVACIRTRERLEISDLTQEAIKNWELKCKK